MGVTDRYRVQHTELVAQVGEIRRQLSRNALAADASSVRSALSRFAGALSLHLAMEDKALYPQLLANPKTAEIAARYQKEMGGLAGTFAEYNKKWQVANIQVEPDGFIAETNMVFAALAKRIERENIELYAVADR